MNQFAVGLSKSVESYELGTFQALKKTCLEKLKLCNEEVCDKQETKW